MKKSNINKFFVYMLFGFLAFMAFSNNVYAGCPLGPNVTKDLRGALKILQYVGPALVVVFTIYEVVMALGKGNLADDMKRLSKRLLKRLIYAMLLFFIPVLVNFFGQLFGILDDASCMEGIRTGSIQIVTTYNK